MESEKLLEQIVENLVRVADEKKAQNIKVYNVSERSVLTDYVVLMSVTNKIHCKSLLADIDKTLSDALQNEAVETLLSMPKISGNVESGWIILDVNSMVVHIILEDLRSYYQLDSLFESNAVTFHS